MKVNKLILSIFVLGYSAKIIPISYLKCDKKIIPEDNLIEVKIKFSHHPSSIGC